jgi:uncharacterized damage-inducible protein DinB
VLADENGMRQLRALGARSVPVVARGDDYVFAQVIGDVVEFLELEENVGPELTPAELVGRYLEVLRRAIELVRQMPDEHLERELPNRPRSWRVLLHHVFQIPAAFIDMEDSGVPMTYENMTAPPGPEHQSSADIARFGEQVRERFERWWDQAADGDFSRRVEVYFGETTRHEMLERTVWHSTQHVRQVASLLEQAGVVPCMPLGPEHIKGLPLTATIWDQAG